MKFSKTNVVLGSMATVASAFPAAVLQQAANDPALKERAAEFEAQFGKRQVAADGATAIFEPIPMFVASEQLVSTSGDHAWVAPTADDLRGPCPGLNAMANHGYLPHNGYATITQFIDATNSVVGMGPQLAAFLAVLGASIDGDGTAWSIGGTPTAAQSAPNPLGPEGNGISGSHNKYESDASPTRYDLYQSGNDYLPNAEQFQQMIDAANGGPLTLDTLTAFRSQRFDTQIQNNPYFFNGPFTGVLVQPAAYTFIYRFMANHSEADPHGILTPEVVASWFGMSGEDGSYTANFGMERIPDNWYKRAVAYPYDNEYFLADAGNAALLYPKFFDVGGNTGKTNSFTGVNVEDLTGGAMNGASLSQGNNFACLAYQFATQVKPDVALGALTQVTNALSPILSALSCPQLEKIDNSQLATFPGYSKSGVEPSL